MNSVTPFGPFALGASEPVLVIAEIGVNHNGLREVGLRQVRAAAASGAHAVKFQTFLASEIATSESPTADYQRAAGEKSQMAMLRRLELSMTDFAAYRDEAARLGVVAFSTPFDPASVRDLAAQGVQLMKIASGEITNDPLIAAVARTGLPTILSTGMSTMDEVAAAVAVHRGAGGGPLALMHCVSSYPAAMEELNLLAIPVMRERFRLPVGLSDHTIGRDAAVAAVALGADLLEKHFTVDRELSGPDHAMSMEPADFAEMTAVVARVRRGLGTGTKAPVSSELEMRTLSRRSIVAARDLPLGHVLSAETLSFKRPGGGLPPSALQQLVGRQLNRAIRSGETVRFEDVS